jgi:hypothetical protein
VCGEVGQVDITSLPYDTKVLCTLASPYTRQTSPQFTKPATRPSKNDALQSATLHLIFAEGQVNKKQLSLHLKNSTLQLSTAMSDHAFLQKMNRTLLTVSDTNNQDTMQETRFWRSKTPSERIAGLEILRQRAHLDYSTTRLQRVYTIRQLKEG